MKFEISVILNIILILALIRIYKNYGSQKKSLDNLVQLKVLMKSIHDKTADLDDKHKICNIILNEAMNFIKFSTHGSLLLINEEGKFEYAAIKGYPEELKRLSFDKEELYLYRINNFREPAILRNLEKLDKDILSEMKFDKLHELGGLNIKSTISFPIHVDGEVIALMNLDSEEISFEDTKDNRMLYEQIKHNLSSIFQNYDVREQLVKLANVDELTGLINKRQFKNIFFEKMRYLRNNYDNDGAFTLVFIDIDNFKRINDEKGHYFGDTALIFFSNLLKGRFEEDVVGRIYGDEFAIIAQGSLEEEIIQKMDNLRCELKDERIKSPISSISYGAITVNKNNCHKDYADLMKDVDELMYKNKRHKKDCLKKLFLVKG